MNDFVVEQGKRLRYIRKDNKLSLHEMGSLVKYEMQRAPAWEAIRKWELGVINTGCSPEYITFLCRTFSANPAYLTLMENGSPYFERNDVDVSQIIPLLNKRSDLRKSLFNYLVEKDMELLKKYLSEIFSKYPKLLEVIEGELRLTRLQDEVGFKI